MQDTGYKMKGARHKIKLNLKASSGVALIAVMWIVTILTVMASEFIYSMRLEIRIARNWSDQVSALYTAKAGLEMAVAILKEDETEYDSLDEDWAEEITGELNNNTYITTLIDESAKININTVDQETLTNVIAHCMTSISDTNISEEAVNSEAQTLAAAIIEKRPYRTVAEMAKVIGMTPELLYGKSADESDDEQENISTNTGSLTITTDTGEEEQLSSILADICTVYSADKNVNSEGGARVNINTADANTLRQQINPQGQQGQEIISQQAAQAIVDYRSQLGQGQNQQGQGQNQPVAQETTQASQASGQGNQGYQKISQLMDVPAISQETLDSIRDRITVDSGQQNNQQNNQQGNQQDNRVNINTADANALQGLSNRIDNGVAQSIIRYRQNNQFDNVDELMQVKLISIDTMRSIVDKVTITEGNVVSGMVNINTAPQEILEMLPGMDEEKALAIVNRRTVAEEQTVTATSQNNEQGPLNSLGQLMDVEGIDENTFRSLIDIVTYRSSTYMIESEGRSSDKKIIQSCTAVVDRSGNRVETKYWKQE